MFYKLFEEDDLEISLPRGVLNTLENALNSKHVEYKIIDKRIEGEVIEINFKGSLRVEQEKAESKMLENENGILLAPTAFGKTILAISLMSKIKGNTLILVDKLTLIDQWKEKILTFTDLKEEDENMDENLHSMIFKVYCEGFAVLITGDITAEGEKALVEHYSGTGKLKADVLKVAHHGSRYSTCDEFLDAVDPEIGVIGVGKNNYGHPADEVIEQLTENDILGYRTDVLGAVGL